MPIGRVTLRVDRVSPFVHRPPLRAAPLPPPALREAHHRRRAHTRIPHPARLLPTWRLTETSARRGLIATTALIRFRIDDGNLRSAFPALQGALVSLGGRTVDFQAALTEHDEALGWALRPDAENRTAFVR